MIRKQKQNMRKLKLYIAISLNGKIADANGGVEWLESIPNPDQSDYGYAKFYKEIDTTIQGNATYKQILSWGIDFPYADKKNYVFTRNSALQNTEHVTFVSENHADFVKQLKKEKGDDIWVVGGGGLNTTLLNVGLIDEIQVFVMPIVLSGGVELFEAFPKQTSLELMESKTYETGAVELRYKVK